MKGSKDDDPTISPGLSAAKATLRSILKGVSLSLMPFRFAAPSLDEATRQRPEPLSPVQSC
ncbi:MAG: hypothetical protein EBV33_01990 [Betaproteobacteria bacterium]|nr:hypothetical protein [Betaproteobacteria bacterium]NBQ08868.1 hypothetical protein [Betaproteobacteria bacterium]NCV58794.1 hypothetical protein [Betaproteobacteria bacterium]